MYQLKEQPFHEGREKTHPPILPKGKLNPARLARRIEVEKSKRSLRFFCERYLHKFFYLPFGPHQVDLFQALERPGDGKRIARAIPREMGKSTTVLVGMPMWELARKHRFYVLLMGAAGGQLWNHFSTLQQEFEQNDLLLEDFPHLEPLVDFKKQSVSWNDSRMKFASGALIEARSTWSKVRGLKEQQYRPDLLLVDDPQDADDIGTSFRRSKFLHRFRTTIMNLVGATGDIVVEGNFMHPESLIATLLLDTSWDRKMWRAENLAKDVMRDGSWPIGNTKFDGSALWPEAWPLERLRSRRDEIKPRAYAIEFLNYMMATDEVTYDSSKFKRFKIDEIDLNDLELFAFWDPANPKNLIEGASCFASITVVGTKLLTYKGRTLRYYWIVHNWMEIAKPEKQTEAALNILRTYNIRRLWYEDNGGFGTMVPYIKLAARNAGVALPLQEFTQTQNKIQRIYHAEATVMQRVFFEARLSHAFLTQWDEFPMGSHIDGPDSTVSAIAGIDRARAMFMF